MPPVQVMGTQKQVDVAALSASAEGDDDRTQLFLRYVLPHEMALRNWLRQRRSGMSDLDDIIQESYAVLAKREQVDDIQNPRDPRAYLFQIAHSPVVRHIRRTRIASILAAEDLDPLQFADASVTNSIR